ncbi:hypothetical protein [Burkholderia sp. L27(2015)]|jgi:hypothetical protein|uniref:hypothetical protein n=1 Tax=Burkholderia sp. L27(2015) TaxID=1641858 RepID=UPI00131B93DC|nr:hypothetical protein [Burkholderia sp. L27(2015)]
MTHVTIRSVEDASGQYCVDFISHPDGTFSAKQFRRDPEDEGRWTLIADYSAKRFATEKEAVDAIAALLPWLEDSASKY